MTEEWHHFAQTVAIDAAREGHFIELALVPTVSTLKANDVAQLHLDDVEVRAPAAARVLRTNVNCTDLGEKTRANLGTLGGAMLATGSSGTDGPACEAFSGLGRRDCEHWFFYTHANALVACELTSEGECKAAEPVFCRVRDPHVTVVREHAR